MPDDKIQINSTSSGSLTGVGFGVNAGVLPAGQANTTISPPTARAATVAWQAFVPGRSDEMSAVNVFSSQPVVDMAALRFQLAMYQSTTDHPQCAVLADTFEDAASSQKLDLTGISPVAVDQLPGEVWRALRGFVKKLDVSPDTSNETADRWRRNLDLPSLVARKASTPKLPRPDEATPSTEAKPGRKRQAVDDMDRTDHRPAKRTGPAVASIETQPPLTATQQTTAPRDVDARNRKLFELLSANPEIATSELTRAMNASAASWPAMNEALVTAIRRDFEAMKAVSLGAAPHGTASQVYAMVRNDAKLTVETIREALALQSAWKVPGVLRVGNLLLLARIAIDNGFLPGTPIQPGVIAAAKGSAERDLDILRMVARMPSISSTWVAARLGENAPKENALKNLMAFVRIIHSAHHRVATGAHLPLERIYLLLRDNERMRADDPACMKVLEDLWKQGDKPPNDFRRFRSLCLLAIDNQVF